MKIVLNKGIIVGLCAVVGTAGSISFANNKWDDYKKDKQITELESQIEQLSFKSTEERESVKYKQWEYAVDMINQKLKEGMRFETYIGESNWKEHSITDEIVNINIPILKNNFKSNLHFSMEGKYEYKIFVELSKMYTNMYADGTLEVVVPNESFEMEKFLTGKRNEAFSQDFWAGAKDSIKKEGTSQLHSQWEKSFSEESDKMVEEDIKTKERDILLETQRKLTSLFEGIVHIADPDIKVIVTIPSLGK